MWLLYADPDALESSEWGLQAWKYIKQSLKARGIAYFLNFSNPCDEVVFKARGAAIFSSYSFSFCFSCRI